ncbi:MAG: efflux RND transporter periplasmic adaptor subunit [Burkholderiales bacterium]
MNTRILFSLKAALALVLVAAAAFAVWLWLGHYRGGAEKLYKTDALKTGNVTQTVSANGTLNPVVLVNVGTQVSGTVKKLHVDFNDRVQAGQILLELDPAVLQAQVKQSEANLSSARAALELALANEKRSRALFEQEFISKQDLDTAIQANKSAGAQVELALAQLAKDRTNFNYSVIRSPVAGVVVNRAVDVGQTVAASFQTPTLFQIAQDLGKMQIDSSFAEADVGGIRVGQPVQFSVDAFPNRSFSAAVRQVRLNATTQQNVVTYDVVVAVDNPEKILMPGMTAYVNVIVAQEKDVLLVPNAALRFRPEEGTERTLRRRRDEKAGGAQATVHVLAEGRLQAVQIGIGISDGRFTEMISGPLKAGDQVVTGNADNAAAQSQSTFRMRMF